MPILKLLNYNDNQVSALEFKLQPNADKTQVSEALQTILGTNIQIKNRSQLNDALYKMLNTENVAVYLIFTLVIIIALFNVIGALIMMILDKKESLHTLFNLGARHQTYILSSRKFNDDSWWTYRTHFRVRHCLSATAIFVGYDYSFRALSCGHSNHKLHTCVGNYHNTWLAGIKVGITANYKTFSEI